MREEVDGARQHYAEQGALRLLRHHPAGDCATGSGSIVENADFVAMSPYAPRFPFETWLLPQAARRAFEEAPRPQYESLARMLKETAAADEPRARVARPINLIVHSSPFSEDTATDFYHWHVEIMPRLTQGRRVRVGDRVLHQPDRRRKRRPEVLPRGADLDRALIAELPKTRVWYGYGSGERE